MFLSRLNEINGGCEKINCTTSSRQAEDIEYCFESAACNLQPCPPGMFIPAPKVILHEFCNVKS